MTEQGLGRTPDPRGLSWGSGGTGTESDGTSARGKLAGVGREDIPLVAIILVGVAVRLWAALQWQVNFDSDEAIFGLMAKHLLQGRYTPTVYGTEHLGSVESVLAAPLLATFGDSPAIFRIAALGLFALFLIAHGIVVRRMFGTQLAALSLVPLSIPGFQILAWTYQPIGAYHALLLSGTLLLLVGLPLLAGRGLRPWRWFLFGSIVGLGLWSNQMILVYLLVIGGVGLLRSEAWARLRRQAGDWWSRVVGLPFEQAVPVGVMGLAALGVLAFFSGGCDPVWRFAKIQTAARLTLLAIGVIGAAGLLLVVRSKAGWLLRAAVLAVAVGIGYAPQWIPWLIGGREPAPVLWASCPTDVFSHVELMLKQLLPAMWGLPIWPTLTDWGPALALPAVMVAIVIVVWLAAALWGQRQALWDAFTLQPLERSAAGSVLWSALFLGPLALSALASNTVDLHSVRHLLVSWQAGGVLLAVAAGRLAQSRGRWPLLATGLLLAVVGIFNLATARGRWLIKFTRYQPEAVASLQDRLSAEGVEAAYADFWGAYTLTFLMDEQVIVAPHNGIDRIPEYTEIARGSDPIAVIQPRAWAQVAGPELEDLLASLAAGNPISGEGAARQEVRDRLERGTLVSRSQVGPWTVWVVDLP